MATTTAVTDLYRAHQLALRARTIRDLIRLWPALDWARLDDTYPAWATAVALLVQRDRRTAAALSSAYLRAFRTAANVPGQAVVVLADDAPAEQVATALRVTSLASIKKATAERVPQQQAMATALVRVSGAATRLVLDGGRDTMRRSLARDPQAAGWSRSTSGGACKFCLMLADRGAVYAAGSADFSAHDHCMCSAAPEYGRGRDVKPYEPSQRTSSDADRARVREWIGANL